MQYHLIIPHMQYKIDYIRGFTPNCPSWMLAKTGANTWEDDLWDNARDECS